MEEKEAFEAIFLHTTDCILLTTPAGVILHANPCATALLGYDQNELQARNTDDFISVRHSSDKTSLWVKRKDGSSFPAEIRNKSFTQKGVSFLLQSITDITQHQAREKEIKTSESLYRAMIEQATDTIYISDGERFYSINPSGCQLFGYSEEEFLKLTASDITFEEDMKANPPRLAELRAGIPIRNERRLKRKDGSTVYVELSAKKMDDGKFLVVARDISDRKKAEERLLKNEIRFKTLIENNNDIISLLDDKFRVIYRSPSAERIMGWSNEEILAMNGTVKVHPDEQDHAQQVVKEILANPGKPIYTLFRNQHKNGHYVWLEGTVTNLLHDKHIHAIVFNYRDITRRMETEEEVKKLNETLELKVIERTNELEKTIRNLRESEGKFEKIFQSNAAGISIVSLKDYTFVEVNKAFESITGYLKNEVIGKTTDDIQLVSNMKNREQIRQALYTVGSVKDLEITVHHKSGALVEVLTAAEVFTIGEDPFVLNIIYDITERKRMEEQLVSVNKELEAFTYSVSHDLRAPLRAVNGYAQILSEDYGKKMDENGNRVLEIIKYNATKMGNLIDDLLTFSRLGRKEIQKHTVDLAQLVEGVVIELNKTTQHRAQLNIGKLHKVKGDYGLLNQAVINLVGNAIKYSSGKKEPVIEIFSEQNANETVFKVKDNGAGFDMRYVDKLFGVFQRLHSDEEFEGTGVGLAIVQRVIAKHGGRVHAEGKTDEGALFQFTLPEN